MMKNKNSSQKFQIKQDRDNNIIISCVGRFGQNENRLKEKMKEVIGHNIKVTQVKDIRREESGKFPLVIRRF